ncbi:glycosyltransferase family 1 protein [Mucor mucedo]|uniref:glycosyltransferase family 1 protein n=1 Tax=Mucor mucedo TaxID=29922 RepID=UPI00221ED128|nr:glycosyltransferase family 1 protein [Mucor mucedo]KAI7892947.1 glycosyltransferase family 1 protein [Mucor mucedo]
MSLFITVGSTGFDNLISQVTSQEFLTSLVRFGITKVRVQYGSSNDIYVKNIQVYDGPRIDITGYKYKASVTEDMEEADIIISHAGSGTILQALRLNKKLIVVVNKALMDNHQNQIAQAMESRNYAVCSDIDDLLSTIQRVQKTSFELFPVAKPEIFAAIVDEQMGF